MVIVGFVLPWVLMIKSAREQSAEKNNPSRE